MRLLHRMRSTAKTSWPYLLICAACVGVDQLTKWLCMRFLEPVGSVTLIEGLLRLTYLENRGAAFGSFSEHRWVFMLFSTVAILAVGAYLLLLCENDRLLRWSLALIVGGGIGNMIDRIALGYVVDFIDFYGIWAYIFNGADSFVCIGAGLLVLYTLLQMKTDATPQANVDGPSDGGAA